MKKQVLNLAIRTWAWRRGIWLLCYLQVPNLVGVPTHFFKVVLAESKSRNLLGAKPVGATGLFDTQPCLQPTVLCLRSPPDRVQVPRNMLSGLV